MEFSKEERMIIEYLGNNKGVSIIPEDIKSKLTPEMLQFTLAELQAKGLVEAIEGGYTLTKKAEELFKKRESIKEEIIAFGHEKILATHGTTIEITKESKLTERGDCIIGVKANKGCKDLKKELKDFLKLGKPIKIIIRVGEEEDVVIAYGSPALKLTDEKDIVIRKSDFIDERTLAILADKAAKDLKRSLVEKLKDPNTKIKITIET